MHIVLFSKDGHIRTLLNKCNESNCIMISDRTNLFRYLEQRNDVDLIVFDELLIKKIDIKPIIFNYPFINLILILTGKVSQYTQEGRVTFLSKPLSIDLLKNILNTNKKKENNLKNFICNEFVGSSDIITKIKKEIELLSKKDCPIMINGESGSGKEIVANIIHKNSSSKDNDMISINCALLNSDISDSILFGHRRGSFTGAEEDTFGLIHKANLSTLFFDEIENISLISQSKLLRVIENKTYRRIGDSELLNSDFRLICASNENLKQLIKKNKFREDFYYRVSMFQINLPSLKEHKEDIDELVFYYLNKKKEQRPLEKGFIKSLKEYSWPGNIRELNNVIEKSRIYSPSNIIRLTF